MDIRTRVPIAAIIGALLLNAPRAFGQSTSPAAPEVSGATAEAPSLAEPKMIHKPFDGVLVAGGLMIVPAYLLQVVAAWGTSASGVVSECPSCYKKEGELYLIPIAGPWLANRAAPPQERGASGPYLLWGGLEALGVVTVLIGLVGHDVPQEPIPEGRNLALLPFVTPRAEGLSMSMRW